MGNLHVIFRSDPQPVLAHPAASCDVAIGSCRMWTGMSLDDLQLLGVQDRYREYAAQILDLVKRSNVKELDGYGEQHWADKPATQIKPGSFT